MSGCFTVSPPPSSQLRFRFLPVALGSDRAQIPSSHHRGVPSFCRQLTMQNAPCSDQDLTGERVEVLSPHPSIDSVAWPIGQADSGLPPIAASVQPLFAEDFPPAPAAEGNRERPITFPHTQHRNVHRSGI